MPPRVVNGERRSGVFDRAGWSVSASHRARAAAIASGVRSERRPEGPPGRAAADLLAAIQLPPASDGIKQGGQSLSPRPAFYPFRVAPPDVPGGGDGGGRGSRRPRRRALAGAARRPRRAPRTTPLARS